MTNEYHQIGLAAARLAGRLPYSVMMAMAGAVARRGGQAGNLDRQTILEALPNPDFRDAAGDFLDRWQASVPSLSAETVAVALATAATSEHIHRRQETVEIVWTGPELADSRFRHTEQAILEVLSSARKRLMVVSYAVYRIPRIRNALVAAANRGVVIQLVIETPNRIDGQGEYDCLSALGENVASASSVYYWPQEHRARDESGKLGILHVKCAIADGERMFLSSANLTEYAFTINMELGILATGGGLPGQVDRYFQRLVTEGVLIRLPPS